MDDSVWAEKILFVFNLIEKEFTDGDPYAVWKAIFFCTKIGCDFPDWVRLELNRISDGLLDIDDEIVGTNYPAYIAGVLGLKRKRRPEDAKRRNASRSRQCRTLMKDGLRRTDIIDILSRGLNRRDAEKIYDSQKDKKKAVEKLSRETRNKTKARINLFERNTPPID